MNKLILREYDIRGTYNQSLSIVDAIDLGLRFANFMGQNNLESICVGYDGRVSSPILFKYLLEGLINGGVKVYDIGLCSTPQMYYSVKNLNTDAGIIVTGSHNPAKDNGFKITLKDRPFFGKDIQNLLDFKPIVRENIGSLEEIDTTQSYIKRLLQDYKPSEKKLKIAWDSGNGVAGLVLGNLIKNLEIDSFPINLEVDGTFPNHHPDPTIPSNLAQLIELVKKNNCDAGIAFDGDGDRIGVVDGTGNIIWGDQLTAILAEEVLKNNKGAKIIGDVKASDMLFEAIEKKGGIPLMAPTGHSLIKNEILKTKALLAGEMSGHIFFADTYYGFDDALYASIRLLNILHHSHKNLSEIFDELPKAYNTPEIRIECCDSKKFKLIDDVKTIISNQKDFEINCVDGIRVKSKKGWWLLRASNTQPAIVLRCESKNQKDLECLLDEVRTLLKSVTLDLPEFLGYK
jgi:phosphomannomutase